MQRSVAASLVSRASALSWAALGVFALALAAAAWVYPGGSWTERDSTGFSVWRNFWCDLVRSRAINGADNGASRALSSLAFAALAFALWCYWRVASALLGEPRSRVVRRLGRSSTLALVGMAVLPSDAHPVLHGAVALAGGGLGMACTLLCIRPRSPGEPRWSARRCSGATALLLAATNAALYVHVAYAGGPETLAQPSVQKLATLALLLWMSCTLATTSRGGPDALQ